ncbi:MAG: hypothetical protein PF484_12670 [Bacteroidales bacterium]|nr:hypothetical protein [Bacteroidales bacterium]
MSLVLLSFLSLSIFAQEVRVSIDTNAILIGEQVKVNINYQFPSDKQGYFPFLPDSLGPNLEIVERSNIDTSFNKGITRFFQELRVTAFDSGYFVLPAFSFGYKSELDSAIQIIVSDPHLINVFTVDADTTQPIKPLVGPMSEPYTLMEFLPWILFILALGALIFTAFYFYRKRQKKPLFKKEEPKIPADEKALDDLARLRLKKLWQVGKVKEYYSELTEIVRIYIEERFDVMAIEMTTHEILDGLEKHLINGEVMQKLKGSLELADLVKFAKANPTPLENDTCLNHGIDFVNETKQIEVETKGEEVVNVG